MARNPPPGTKLEKQLLLSRFVQTDFGIPLVLGAFQNRVAHDVGTPGAEENGLHVLER